MCGAFPPPAERRQIGSHNPSRLQNVRAQDRLPAHCPTLRSKRDQQRNAEDNSRPFSQHCAVQVFPATRAMFGAWPRPFSTSPDHPCGDSAIAEMTSSLF